MFFELRGVDARFLDEGGAVLGISFHCLMEQRLNALPHLGGHCLDESSFFSHARAIVQSRLTVRGETLRFAAISSKVRPPKKCSSRISACLGSNRAN